MNQTLQFDPTKPCYQGVLLSPLSFLPPARVQTKAAGRTAPIPRCLTDARLYIDLAYSDDLIHGDSSGMLIVCFSLQNSRSSVCCNDICLTNALLLTDKQVQYRWAKNFMLVTNWCRCQELWFKKIVWIGQVFVNSHQSQNAFAFMRMWGRCKNVHPRQYPMYINMLLLLSIA